MKIWQITAPNELTLAERQEAVSEGFIKVKMTRAAITNFDMGNYTGKYEAAYPLTPVRLGAGIVSEVPEGEERFARGQRVVIEPYIPCGNCSACLEKETDYCADMKVLGNNYEGLLRDFVVLPKGCLHILPDHVKDTDAVFTDFIAIALHALDHLHVEKGENIAIVGAGALGVILSHLAMYYQAVPILIDSNQEKLDSAKETGIYYTVNTSAVDANKKVLEITGGRMCERVAYHTVAAEKAQRAFSLAASGASVVFLGIESANEALNANMFDIVKKSLVVSGVNNGRGYIPRAINMLATNVVNVSALVSTTVEFADLDETLKKIASTPLANTLIGVKV